MLRNWFCIVVAGVWTTLMFPIAALLILVDFSGSVSIWWARRMWSPVLLWAGGATLEVVGLENIDPKRATIYVSNHQSTIDIPTLFMALPVNLKFIAKKQLVYVPFLGWYLWLAKFILIDRSNRARAIASLEEGARRIRAGVSLIVYAEGTRSDGPILPFKKGSFALALLAKVPICPVTIEGSGKLMPKNRWTITPGPIRVKIGAPIDTTGFGENDRDRLVKVVRDRIIAQSLELGGQGGDRDDAVAAPGLEGIGRAKRSVDG